MSIQPLSRSTLAAWGKTSEDPAARKDREKRERAEGRRIDPVLTRWLPIFQHHLDAGSAAGLLWDQRVSPAVKRHITEATGVPADEARRILQWLAAVHDVGKASPAFAIQASQHQPIEWKRVPEVIARLDEHNLPIGQWDGRNGVGHATVSSIAVQKWLTANHDAPPRHAALWGSIVGTHHGLPPEASTLLHAERKTTHNGMTGPWATVQAELLEMAARRFWSDQTARWLTQPTYPEGVQRLLLAWLVAADWFSSNETFFPHLRLDQDVEVLPSQEERAAHAWEASALPPLWVPQEPPVNIYLERFGFDNPRPSQLAAVEAAWTMDPNGLLIISDEMGIGKAEASLAAAEVLAFRAQASGIMFALPTQATTDAMFERLLPWFTKLPGTKDVTLTHGAASMNEKYQALPGWHRSDNDEDPTGAHRVIATEWLTGKTGPLAGFQVNTIDQVLLGALDASHVSLRHAGMAGKVVIIDEVHAVDLYMSTYLERMLTWLGSYDVPVILVSATLPHHLRNRLYEAHAAGRRLHANGPAEITWPKPVYPSITYSSRDGQPTNMPIKASRVGRKVHLQPLGDDIDSLVRSLRASLRNGGCALVLRNTVTRVQEVAAALEAHFPGQVDVLHARFISPDRRGKEYEAIRRFGKAAGVARPHRRIVVASQVIEQSLDVDFDVLYTDIAPMDLLIQRLGRLYRHHRPGRPTSVARAFITGVTDWNAVPAEVFPHLVYVYEPALLVRTLGVLISRGHLGPDARPVCIPADVPDLVEAVYGAEVDVVPEAWRDAVTTLDEQHAQAANASTEKARTFLLRAPRTSKRQQDLVGSQPAPDLDADKGDGLARVRDGIESLEALVVVQDHEGRWMVPPWLDIPGAGLVVSQDRAPSHAAMDALRRCKIRFGVDLSGPWAAWRTKEALAGNAPESWQMTPWIRGQMVLVLDADSLEAEVGERIVTYDPHLGLRTRKRVVERALAA